MTMIPADRHPAEPPPGPWVMVQRWHDLLFAHWRCPISDLRPLIPDALEIETFDGHAWISVIPFYMTGVRVRGTPPVPTANEFEELNVRTYVTLDGRPGIWFFSLDCASLLAVVGARVGVYLPYYRATMRMSKSTDGLITYESKRWPVAGPPAAFAATYRATGPGEVAAPGTLDHFLTERYSLYSSDGTRIWREDIFHARWNLQPAEAQIEHNSMIAAAGVRAVAHPPKLHFGAFQDVRFWWPVQVR
ncbi:MAG TPA: DUF2071 domain-containing protein [Vicinamibacterales bacterium]|nr:DUF2071 domain-containing protein [Vicinamibacterales bacterium]